MAIVYVVGGVALLGGWLLLLMKTAGSANVDNVKITTGQEQQVEQQVKPTRQDKEADQGIGSYEVYATATPGQAEILPIWPTYYQEGCGGVPLQLEGSYREICPLPEREYPCVRYKGYNLCPYKP